MRRLAGMDRDARYVVVNMTARLLVFLRLESSSLESRSSLRLPIQSWGGRRNVPLFYSISHFLDQASSPLCLLACCSSLVLECSEIKHLYNWRQSNDFLHCFRLHELQILASHFRVACCLLLSPEVGLRISCLVLDSCVENNVELVFLQTKVPGGDSSGAIPQVQNPF